MRRFTPASVRSVNSIATLRDRHLIGARGGLLAADVERQAVRIQPHLAGAQHQLARILDRGAELARQRPVGALVLHQDAAVDARTGRMLGELLQFLGGIEGEQRHAAREGGTDRRHLLDGVAEADRLRAARRLPGSRRPPPSLPRRNWSRGLPAAPAPGAPDWPSRRNRSAPVAARAAERGSSLPRDPRPAPGTALPADAAQEIGRFSGSSHRASFGWTPT